MEVKDILGLDIGDKRTGIARASSVAKLSEPLMSVPAKDTVDALLKYIDEHAVEAIAVGLPRSLRSEDTKQTTAVRAWVKHAQERINIPFYWQDEALTSREAAGKLQTSNLKDQKLDEHSLAAAIILQDFLDMAETGRMVA